MPELTVSEIKLPAVKVGDMTLPDDLIDKIADLDIRERLSEVDLSSVRLPAVLRDVELPDVRLPEIRLPAVEVAALARQGLAVLLISSELPEILGMSDRILVMRDGRLVGEVPRAEATEERLVAMGAGAGDGG